MKRMCLVFFVNLLPNVLVFLVNGHLVSNSNFISYGLKLHLLLRVTLISQVTVNFVVGFAFYQMLILCSTIAQKNRPVQKVFLEKTFLRLWSNQFKMPTIICSFIKNSTEKTTN